MQGVKKTVCSGFTSNWLCHVKPSARQTTARWICAEFPVPAAGQSANPVILLAWGRDGDEPAALNTGCALGAKAGVTPPGKQLWHMDVLPVASLSQNWGLAGAQGGQGWPRRGGKVKPSQTSLV